MSNEGIMLVALMLFNFVFYVFTNNNIEDQFKKLRKDLGLDKDKK